MTHSASALYTLGLQPVHVHFQACSWKCSSVPSVFALGLSPQVMGGGGLTIWAFVCPTHGTLTGQHPADAQCLESASRNTGNSRDTFSGRPSTREQLDKQSSLMFWSFFLFIHRFMSSRLLPSSPPQIFSSISFKKLLVSLLAWAPTSRSLEMEGIREREKKTYPRKLIYTRTPPTVGSWPPKELERISRGSEALEPRAQDLLTSVVSEGRTAFLIQFPLPHQHQYSFSSPQVYPTPLPHDLISPYYPNYCLVTLSCIAHFPRQQGWTKNLNFKRNSTYFLPSLSYHEYHLLVGSSKNILWC